MLSKKEKSQMKTNRTNDIFISVTKEMIIKEGALQVSTRKIADQSGYSLGTLYNYFENVDALMWLVRSQMVEDINDYVKTNIGSIESIEDLCEAYIEFAKYFISNPKIYEFFFLYKLNCDAKPADEKPHVLNVYESLQFLIDDGTIKDDDAPIISQTIVFSIYGMLTLFFSQYNQVEEEYIYLQIPKIIKRLICK